ncbi:MAG: sigma-70 family RNA polymerase sigma factor [Actinobacteria bacterium]|nr:sigma-70 family RNA polymerase sigma factor [Actinomycetota bacterium]
MPAVSDAAVVPATTDDFEDFFDHVFPRAVRVARRLIGDPIEAEDLAAEALARAYARWPSVRRHPSPDGWVLRATINLGIDMLRKAKRTPELAAVEGPEDVVALRLTLAAAMSSLSRRQREIVTLRYLADLSEHDVAAALAITPGSVKTHLSRALDRMRGSLGSQWEEVTGGFT